LTEFEVTNEAARRRGEDVSFFSVLCHVVHPNEVKQNMNNKQGDSEI